MDKKKITKWEGVVGESKKTLHAYGQYLCPVSKQNFASGYGVIAPIRW